MSQRAVQTRRYERGRTLTYAPAGNVDSELEFSTPFPMPVARLWQNWKKWYCNSCIVALVVAKRL